jgi:diadenosine tetraphosphate (Ap4A) HIT family hydrolase
MATIFTRIITGELPGRFVWRDERAVAFLSINPLRPGHTLVVPVAEIDHWLDVEPSLLAHLTAVAQSVGKAVHRAFNPTKVGLMLAGLEVPHVHFHVVPITSVHDLDFAKQDMSAKPADLDRAAEQVRTALRALGYRQVAG